MSIAPRIKACTLCRERFAATRTAHRPRPVVWYRPGARILVAGQAPGARVHEAGIPFHDRSGDRLRDWLGMSKAEFYDLERVAIVPMAFCFPGYDAKGADLPPPAICARTWHEGVMSEIGTPGLRILVGGAAQNWHLGKGQTVTQRVRDWEQHFPTTIPLPHPSWRNTAWLRKNPWFEAELLPVLKDRVRKVLNE
ncbi:uracil-DNA glycosylase family protein [Ponticoccus sp. SC2-23]|uniref:uracil-DNA glycosylase family protein n=1 Tax=Alexandriicola marinus TaxID=2081710 RepID=UPI000FD78DF8|nr:uracil-DNA glycosylase family protein [Alexandriicola marinus]MBM1219733.1 uracil-DNA glycosylase family protein [Ponticoccus sp. SC6-9]MBM1223195.1 uracil-DNA glycosylase family protein [Ponticoccus sp. SC6-15]MBM1229546.1 uracil-DNA glycosylase family protein [Ponticoccus sp. SC6-38]MBM1232161.1 uracil-DNA glycosylase family protein [Ponticoccus sp. SC6-45]MBM1237889.1 uracil-DNA glycosylase family protein [Ponticoccus sp. SC6-49]MBM1241172.1 uracil-DNA glycosylase family protein [Pontic